MAIASVGGLSASSMTPALAQVTRDGGVHFQGTPTCQLVTVGTDQFAIECSGNVAGAGTGAIATVSATVTTGCINPGSKSQEPKGLQDTAVTGSAEVPSVEGGSTPFTVTSNAIVIDCPGQQTPTVVDVTTATVTVTAQTGTTSATVPVSGA